MLLKDHQAPPHMQLPTKTLQENYSLEPGDPDDPLDRHMATVTCNHCAETWDVKMPLLKGAATVLEQHWGNKHGPRGAMTGGIRLKRNYSSRMERKVDNVLALVSYLPGLRPLEPGWRVAGKLLLQPSDEGGSDGSADGGEDGLQQALPIDGGDSTCEDGSERDVGTVQKD